MAEVISLEVAAARYAVKLATLQRMCRKKIIPSVTVDGVVQVTTRTMEQMFSEPKNMTLEVAAERYNVKLSTLRLMCASGKVASIKPGKRRYVTSEAMDLVFTAMPK